MAYPAGNFLDVNSPLIQDEPYYTSHVYWDQSGFHESKGFAWTTVGLPTLNLKNANAGFPAFVSGLSDTIHYVSPTNSEALDTTGDRYGMVAFIPQAIDATARVWFNDGVAATGGFNIGSNGTTGFCAFTCWTPGTTAATTTNAIVPYVVNVATYWKTGANGFVQLNLGPIATGAMSEVSGTGQPAYIGRYNATGSSFNGGMVEIINAVGTMPTGWNLRVAQTVFDKCGSANAWIRG